MGGFEGADHINARGDALDMVTSSGHLRSVDENYRALAQLGILTVRESVGWRAVQPSLGVLPDFTRLDVRTRAAKANGMQVIWTIMHYGTPKEVSLLCDSFIEHFSRFALTCVERIVLTDEAPIINLINEISFLSWAVSQTDFVFPYRGGGEGARSASAELGFQVKCRLVKAVLTAMQKIKKKFPQVRFLHVEPIIHVVPPLGRPDLAELATEVRGYQWQTWELLRGTMCPELGGSPEALDLMGVNYYYNGQLEIGTDIHLDWCPPDPRRMQFSDLLTECWERYERPLIISETGHIDDGRYIWLNEIFSEVNKVLSEGRVDLRGVCIYPIIDRPCWHEPSKNIACGLVNDQASVETLLRWQKILTTQNFSKD